MSRSDGGEGRIGEAFEAGVRLHAAGEFGRAAECYRELLAREPEHSGALVNLGQCLRRLGREDEALDCYERAAGLPDAGFEVWFNLGNVQFQRKRYRDAEHSYGEASRRAPGFAGAPFQLGCVFRDEEKYEAALTQYGRALELEPSNAMAHMNAGTVLRALGRLDEALGAHRAALGHGPDSWEVHFNLALTLDELGEGEESGKFLESALGLAPDAWPIYHNLGEALVARGELGRAEAAYDKALGCGPDRLRSRLGIAHVFLRTGREREAHAAFGLVVDRAGEDVVLLAEVATLQWRFGLKQEAVGVLRRIAELQPNLVDAHLNLARALGGVWELGEAIEESERALALDPACARAKHLLGVCLVKQGRVEEGLAAYRAARDLDGAVSDEYVASELFSSLYSDGLDALELAELHRTRMADWGGAERPSGEGYANSRDGDRVLRVGYLSPDLKGRHPVALFMEAVLGHHDGSRVEVFCYSSVDAADETTRRFEGMCAGWREVRDWPDARLNGQIRADGIDILVDLAGHTEGSRLRAMRERPAPVQASFIGYPHSTGLASIDYLIADGVVCPPEDDGLCAEEVVRLDGCVFCYSPVEEMPAVNLERARARSEVVFGSFNHVPKLTGTTVALWAGVLNRVPGSRLLLKAAPFQDGSTRERYWGLFGEEGIARERVTLDGPSGFLETMRQYAEIDVALDPVPYNGGTTTFQALWMGVPVVTLRGGNFCGRMGASILGALGLEELIAQSADAYVEIAAGLAREREGRLGLREGLRGRMAGSVLCDGAGYTRNLEEVYRRMWRGWCEDF